MAPKNVEDFPTFCQILQFPSSGLMSLESFGNPYFKLVPRNLPEWIEKIIKKSLRKIGVPTWDSKRAPSEQRTFVTSQANFLSKLPSCFSGRCLELLQYLVLKYVFEKTKVHLHETIKFNEFEQHNGLSQHIVQSCRLRQVLKLLHELQGRGEGIYLVLIWGAQGGGRGAASL